MKPGYGYWVKSNQEGLSIQIQGQMKPVPLNLTEGWNLVGSGFFQSLPVEDALVDIGREVESLWGYKDGVWFVCDPQNSGLSDLKVMESGRGLLD